MATDMISSESDTACCSSVLSPPKSRATDFYSVASFASLSAICSWNIGCNTVVSPRFLDGLPVDAR